MSMKRILLSGFLTIIVFTIVLILARQPKLTNENLFVQFFEWFDFTSVRFWEDITLFVLSWGTSLVLWKRQAWGNQVKANRPYCLFAGIFSLISLILILAAVRLNANVFIFSLFCFLITSLMISTALHLRTLQMKFLPLEFIKIIFLSFLVIGINIFSSNLVSHSHHRGETWESQIFFTIIFGAIAAVISLIINSTIILKQIRGKI